MALQHVADHTSLIVVATASFNPDRFRGRDLDMVDIVAIPERFKDTVNETQHKEVLNRLLAQVMIDAIDLLLGKYLVDILIQLLRRLEIPSERLLYNQPRPAA